jgi:hypothetical protein
MCSGFLFLVAFVSEDKEAAESREGSVTDLDLLLRGIELEAHEYEAMKCCETNMHAVDYFVVLGALD